MEFSVLLAGQRSRVLLGARVGGCAQRPLPFLMASVSLPPTQQPARVLQDLVPLGLLSSYQPMGLNSSDSGWKTTQWPFLVSYELLRWKTCSVHSCCLRIHRVAFWLTWQSYSVCLLLQCKVLDSTLLLGLLTPTLANLSQEGENRTQPRN